MGRREREREREGRSTAGNKAETTPGLRDEGDVPTDANTCRIRILIMITGPHFFLEE